MSDLVDRMRKAILTNKKAEVEKLLSEGFPLNKIVFYKDVAAIHYAVKERRHEILEILLKADALVDLPTVCDKQTALHIACWEGDQKSVELLLAAGASHSARDKDKFTPVMQTLRDSKTARLLPLLLKAGGSVETLKDGRSPLHQICDHDDPAAVFLLAAAGADVNSPMSGLTPLMKIIDELVYYNGKPAEKKISRARLPIIEALMKCGANALVVLPKNVSDPETRGMTILEVARHFRMDPKIIAALESPAGSKSKVLAKTSMSAAAEPVPPRMPRDPAAIWTAIIEHLKPLSPSVAKSFHRGATEKQIASVAALSKRALPADFTKFWGIRNGQKSSSGGLFTADQFDDEYVLLSTTEIVREWKIWNKLLVSGEFESESAIPESGVREAWYHSDWIPIASNTGGDFFCLDLSPARGGRKGQIISLKHDSPERTIVAKSVAELLWRTVNNR